jgi:hypothetical protein
MLVCFASKLGAFYATVKKFPQISFFEFKTGENIACIAKLFENFMYDSD